jgi:preprotein translocase subunit SecE
LARQTRQQRRARREQSTESKLTARARARQAQVRPAAQVPKTQTGSRPAIPGGGTRRFVSESWAELKKVEWPGQKQIIQATVVVLIACAIVGVYLWGADQVFKRLVENVFLR